MMNGLIKNFRRGRNTQYPNQLIIQFKPIKSKSQASSLVGRKVVWTTRTNKKIIGKIMAAHGSNGAVRAKFSRGLPGDALGQKIELIQ